MPTPFPTSATPSPAPNGFRVATTPSQFNFDDQNRWATIPGVPVLDEHELTDSRGQASGVVDARFLQEVANNNNRRFAQTGDATPLTRGHTSDDPSAPDPPVLGYAVNFRVAPWRNGRNALYADFKVDRRYEKDIDNSRRSVELWFAKREVDPIAVLKATTPERDLGVILRNARIDHIVPGSTRRGGQVINPTESPVIKYSLRRGQVIRYAMGGLPVRFNCGPKKMSEGSSMAGMNGMGNGKTYSNQDASLNYADDEMETEDMPPEDDGGGDEGGGSPFGGGGGQDSGEDPAVAAVLQSKGFKQAIRDAVMEALTAIESEPAPGMGGGDPGMEPGGMGGESPTETGMEPGMGGPPGGGMGGPGMPPNPEEEAAEFHGERPVKFDDSMMYSGSAFPGSTNTFTPDFGGIKKPTAPGAKKMNRQQTPVRRQQQTAPPQQQPEVVRLRRTVDVMARKLARADAEKLIAKCKEEGIVFADENDEVTRLAQLDEAGQKFMLDQYRKNYRRREADPANPAYPGVARFARPASPESGGDDAYEPSTPAEAQELANYIRKNQLPWDEGVKKFARERKNTGATPRR